MEKIEVGRVKDYLMRSFATFTNPEYYAPDEKIYNNAIDWVTKNVVKKNKDMRLRAEADFPKMDKDKAYKESGKMMAEAILKHKSRR